MANNYLSIDVGGTTIKYGLLDHSGTLLEDGVQSTPQSELDVFLNQIDCIIIEYLDRIKGIAFSIPGKINKSNGTIYFGGALPYLNELPLKQIIEEKYNLPVSLENDGKAAALAEFWLGNLKGHLNSAAIVLGTGIGGGIFLNGSLLQGEHFQAGELSFMIDSLSNENDATIFGMSGSAVSMIRTISLELGLETLTDGKAVFQEIDQGNNDAMKTFKFFCQTIAKLIMNVQAVVDLDKIVIGGGISQQLIVIQMIQLCYDEIHQKNPLIQMTMTPPEISQAYFINKANLYGAVYSLLLQLNNED